MTRTPAPDDPQIYKVCLELEVTGTGQELRSALARFAQEQRDPMIQAEDLESIWRTSTREQILSEIIDILQLQEQIQRVLSPLTVKAVGVGPRISRTAPVENAE